MKYSVTIEDTGRVTDEYNKLNKGDAQKVAAIEAAKPENNDNQIFVSFYRPSDGQRGYLNPDGNHDITGKKW